MAPGGGYVADKTTHTRIGDTTDAAAAGDGSLIGIVKRVRDLLAGALSVTEASPGTVRHGVATVAVAGTRVALAGATTAIQSVTVRAHAGNTGTIYVGGSTVTSANGFRLAKGDAATIVIADLAAVYIDASVSGEGVSYLAT